MMRKSVFSLVLFSPFLFAVVETPAQSDQPRFEVGGQFSVLRVDTRTVTVQGGGEAITSGGATDYGFGGRFGYNFSKYLAIEAEGNFFPRNSDLDGGRKTQGLFGVRVGKRFGKFGIFAKARPGFVRYAKGDYRFVSGPAVIPPPLGSFQSVGTTNFAFDIGAVVEFYPSKRTIIRFDVGDTFIRQGARNVAAFQFNAPSPGFGLVALAESAETRHHPQISVGFGFRF